MTISVLIATCNRPELLSRAVASILRCTKPAHEIVVADQSDDETTETVLKGIEAGDTQIRHVRLTRRGKAHALNEAIRVSSGELLALTDDDVEVDPSWLEAIERLDQAHPRVHAFCGRVLPEPGTDPERYLNLVRSTEPRRITRRTSPLSPGFCGANIVVQRATMLAVGSYNEHFGPGGRFRNNDDGELAYRLTRQATDVLFSPSLVVYHSGWRRESDNTKLHFDYAYGVGAFAGYYLRRGHLLPALYLLKRCLSKLQTLLVSMIVRQPTRVLGARTQLGGFCRGFLAGVAVSDAARPAAVDDSLDRAG